MALALVHAEKREERAELHSESLAQAAREACRAVALRRASCAHGQPTEPIAEELVVRLVRLAARQDAQDLLSRGPVLCLQGCVELGRHQAERAAVSHDLLRLLVDRGGHEADGLVVGEAELAREDAPLVGQALDHLGGGA